MKKWIAILLLVGTLCGLLAGCGKKEITAEEAWQVVLKDLGDKADQVGEPHYHEIVFAEKESYEFSITLDGLSLLYVVSKTGKILYEGPGEHSH